VDGELVGNAPAYFKFAARAKVRSQKMNRDKIISLDQLAATGESPSRRGQENCPRPTGCFDLLHVGQCAILKPPGALGDALIVGITATISAQLKRSESAGE